MDNSDNDSINNPDFNSINNPDFNSINNPDIDSINNHIDSINNHIDSINNHIDSIDISIGSSSGSINYPDINNVNNSDLIEKIESAAINYIFLVKEAISRISGKQFSDEEYNRFVEIGEKMGISIIDFISVVKHDVDKYKTKEVVTRAISDVIDKAYDKDR